MTVPFVPTLIIAPSKPRVAGGGTVALTASGGSGSGYTFAITTSKSGGSITGSTYTAGSLINTTDVVTVTDDDGNTAAREIEVCDDESSLANIRTECQQRTDLVNSNFIVTSEWNRMINKSAYVLYDILVAAHGNDYNVAEPFIFTTDGLTERYPLPPDFFKLLGLDIQVTNTTNGWLGVPRFNFAERNEFMVPYQVFYGTRSNLHYRLRGSKLWLLPIAAAGQYMQVHYVPKMTLLVNDTDVLNGLSGWEEFVIADVCIKACVKRETDASPFEAEMQRMAQRVQVIAEERDLGAPATVSDVRSQFDERNSGEY